MKLRQRLSDLHQVEHAILTGNGTTAISVALQALDVRGKKVGIPNNVCLNVPAAIYNSGNEPEFLDITHQDFGLDPRLLSGRKDLGAVIAVNAYGHVCDIEAINQQCKALGIPLIEDFAVAQGARREGRPVGGGGDVSIVSFGAGKIVELGHGGAALTRDPRLARELQKLMGLLPDFSADREAAVDGIQREFKRYYNANVERGLNREWRAFSAAFHAARPSFDCKFAPEWEGPLLKKLDTLDEEIRVRAANSKQLIEEFRALGTPGVELLEHSKGSTYWRFNILVRKGRDALLKHLLTKQLKISSWYTSIDQVLRDRATAATATPVADQMANHILNLWVNNEIDSKYLKAVTREIDSFLRSERI